jgi:hypothetical protein
LRRYNEVPFFLEDAMILLDENADSLMDRNSKGRTPLQLATQTTPNLIFKKVLPLDFLAARSKI